MTGDRIAVIIIAAGYSSRMNGFKPMYQFKERTAVERLIDTYRSSGIRDIYIVVGYNSTELINRIKDPEVVWVMNESYAEGMLTSIKRGILALDKKISAFFMQPVDIPLIKTKTLDFLTDTYYKCNKGVIYPAFDGEKGHPPLICCKYSTLITNSPDEGGLKQILKKFENDSVCVPVCDKAILMDMDRTEDYEKLLAYDRLNAPDMDECQAIRRYYNVPEPVCRHCDAVERIAHMLFMKLSLCGVRLDGDALFAAALLHDMVRYEKKHAAAGADIVRSMGYNFVGDIIATHMDLEVREGEPLTENEILYLADKIIEGDRICSLDEKFSQALRDKGDSPEAIVNIKKRWQAAKLIVDKIERITGTGIQYDKTHLSDQAWKDTYRKREEVFGDYRFALSQGRD